jgi:hypothetical protein
VLSQSLSPALPRYPSTRIPRLTSLHPKVIPSAMPQMRPASGRDRVMILHFLFAVKGEVMVRFICHTVYDTRGAQPPSAVARSLCLFLRLRGETFGADPSYGAGGLPLPRCLCTKQKKTPGEAPGVEVLVAVDERAAIYGREGIRKKSFFLRRKHRTAPTKPVRINRPPCSTTASRSNHESIVTHRPSLIFSF